MFRGDRLKALRKERKINQESLAKDFGLGRSTISQYETIKREPDTELIVKFADFFNVTTDYLLGRTNIRNPYALKANVEEKAVLGIDVTGISSEGIKAIETYVDFVKQRYSLNRRK